MDYILWDVSPVIITIGKFAIRWYSMLIATAFFIGFLIIRRMFEKEGVPEKDFSKFIQYLFFSTIIGLRLGHCLFYDPIHYLTHPLEILKVWEGGLASHGAVVGILIGLGIYVYKHKKSFIWLADRVIIIALIIGAMVRVGNLMNSEIIGSPTDNSNAFLFVNSVDKYMIQKNPSIFEDSRFEKTGIDTVVDDITYTKLKLEVDFKRAYDSVFIQNNMSSIFPHLLKQRRNMVANLKLFSSPSIEIINKKGGSTAVIDVWAIPRFPSQLFEAIFCVLLFVVYLTIYIRTSGHMKSGIFFSTFFIALFVFRFFIEFIKKEQVDFENGMLFNMGQLLSIPFVILGVVSLVYFLKNKKQYTFSK